MKVFSIGYSTRNIDEFVEILNRFGVVKLVDVRTMPGSRYNPQFNQEILIRLLSTRHIEYTYIKKLGGLRHSTVKDSKNDGWRNRSFRSYADYMQTEDFSNGLEELIAIAEKSQVAIMCAEAVPWRCHRSLISDALIARGIEVYDLIDGKTAKEHEMTSFALVEGVSITYPASKQSKLF